ncbi:MAG: bifunctional UDP-N-acetylmuramoyl-tripeptide:D-alanyl-D-alanine ligase/alanine racemase [Bacteroidales bacterium]|nr:bifunctional UDP-N-acetylmuramoyl-tripeptide:D-alanyl-D-alanine ligase/alanine racemase [Bacteroidales bacterium]
MKILSADIASITKGKLLGPGDLIANEIVTDSRQLSFTTGQIFAAIKGKNHDGHIYIGNLYRKGVRVFIVESPPDEIKDYSEAAFILTGSTVEALQLIASFIRDKFKSPVIAVTGSAGKTIVKEWLADILGLTTPVIRSPKSYNSQIGVPLSVLKLDEKYKLGIFEAGISLPGEMSKLQRIIKPDIGVLTNIGDAHRENFADDKSKATEKLLLFKNASIIVYCSDQKLVNSLILADVNLKSKRLVNWSFRDQKAKVFVTAVTLADGKTSLKIVYEHKNYDFIIPFSDRASVENAITVASVCLALGTDASVISAGLKSLVSVAMRMELKSGINNCQLIEDYYNSDPGSLWMALEYLKSQNGKEPALILSDFVQSGRDEKELYGEVAQLIKKTGIRKFIGIGKSLIASHDLFEKEARFYNSTEEFVSSFNGSDFRNEIILIKGARVFEFEKIGKLLEQQIHQTVLEVNLDAISHNLNEFRSHLNPGTRIMAMVKAFAYGAGPAEIAALLEYHRVSYLAVAYADEGIELRNAGVTLPVMVMNPDPSSSDLLIKYSLEPEIYSFGSYELFTTAALRHGLLNYPVHIKIDTGMHRLGFMPEDVPALAEKLRESECLKVVSVFSHLAASEDPELDHFTLKQVKVFLEAVDQIKKAVSYPFLRHILNSSGILRFPEYQFEMVRPGIGMYGVGNFSGLALRTTGRFKTRISQVKSVKAGDPVGYGCADISYRDRDIAILPVGYADGLSRKLGNRVGELFIKGKRVPIIGNVCMDMCMTDVSGTDAKEGDEAEIFGDNITIREIAVKCGTIPYEILTSIPQRVKRVFIRE